MSEPQIIVISPDDVRPAGQHRTGSTIGDLGMTTDVGSPCYPYKCTPTCQHAHKRAAQAATTPEGASDHESDSRRARGAGQG